MTTIETKFWNIKRVEKLKSFLENEWRSENFTTRELMESYYHHTNDGKPDEYIPKSLIDEVLK
jgi:hypothetical protein